MWETIVKIEEAFTNRVMDVVVGMLSFWPAYFVLAPKLAGSDFVLAIGLLLIFDVVLSVFGWTASKKAAALELRLRERYQAARVRRAERRAFRETVRRRVREGE